MREQIVNMKFVMEPLRNSYETLSTQNLTILRNFQVLDQILTLEYRIIVPPLINFGNIFQPLVFIPTLILLILVTNEMMVNMISE